MTINPNSERCWIKEYPSLSPQEQVRRYPLFFKNIHFDPKIRNYHPIHD